MSIAAMWWLRYPRCFAWTVVPFQIRGHSRLFSVASEWKGSSHSTSDFVTHVLAGDNAPTVQNAVASVLPSRRNITNESNFNTADIPLDNTLLTPKHYLKLGAIWFLPADAPRDPSQGQKPVRLSTADLEKTLEEGDYLRVHHTPRRFPLVYNYNWTLDKNESSYGTPGVVVARDDEKGFWVIDKPSHVPVHPTVDNVLENVAHMIQGALVDQGEGNAYVTTPQRLDQNTSGLFVVARKKSFASYYAKLLRRKTDQQLSNSPVSGAIHKRYKCLLCLIAPDDDGSWSVASAVNHLARIADEQQVIRHYLEPSIRAPKNFVATPGNDTWAECLLRLTNISQVYPLVGSVAAKELALSLWSGDDSIPPNCLAVMEGEVELLTGRTHQIRGQLSAEGFPLVGDAQYGGAIPNVKEGEVKSTYYIHSDDLALHCSQVEFLDPDVVTKHDGTTVLVPSDRWNTFRLEECWWTPLLEKYVVESSAAGEATTSLYDTKLVSNLMKRNDAGEQVVNEDAHSSDDVLPPQVQLSPGAHKYVLVKATHPSGNGHRWYVKSAAPSECGGLYHANVAHDLVDWLQAAGYETVVTGGGRIKFNAETQEAIVFGFSYGFGKGNHKKAASVISEWSNGSIKATFDDSDSLY